MDNKYSFEVTGDVVDAVSIYEYSDEKGLHQTDSQKIVEKQEKAKKDEEENIAPINPDSSLKPELDKHDGSGSFNPVQTPVHNDI